MVPRFLGRGWRSVDVGIFSPDDIGAGEFGELLLADAGGYILEGEQSISASPAEMVALLEAVLRRPGLSPAEREYTLTALMKLSARLTGVANRVQVITDRRQVFTSVQIMLGCRRCAAAGEC